MTYTLYTLAFRPKRGAWQIFSRDFTSRREAEEVGQRLWGAPRWEVYPTHAA